MRIAENAALLEQLAASHALGTLRGGARRRFENLARHDASIRAVVLVWQGRMNSLVELQAKVAPDPAVWKRIHNLLQAHKAADVTRRPPAERSGGSASRGWWHSVGLWRGAAAMGAVAATVATVAVTSGLDANEQLRGRVAQLSASLANAPEIQYVAVLGDEQSAASMLVTFDPKNNRLLLKRVGSFVEQPDRSLQLWAVPASGGPTSLGVLGRDPVIRLAATGQVVRDTPTLAISLEPVGGAPAGSGPTGPVLFKGQLIETVR